MTSPSLRAKLRLRAPLPNLALLRDEASLTLDGETKTLSLTRTTNSEIIYESETLTLERKALNLKTLGKGLVAEYLFYEGTGTTLHDSSGYGNHGTIYGATWKKLSNGKYVLEFDGADDYVCISNVFIPEDTEFSGAVEAVVKLVSSLDEQIVFGAYDKFRVAAYKDGGLGFYYDARPTRVYTKWIVGIGSVQLNTWFHMVVSWSPTEVVFYINGSRIETVDVSDAPVLVGNGCVWCHIGHGVGSYQHYLGGSVALVRVWLRSLTDDEVKALYELAKLMVLELGA